MDHLPPSEIRRRGDTLRRRRTALVATGGVLAAAIAIGTPVIALSGGTGPDRDGSGQVATDPSAARTHDLRDTPPAGWVTTIPDGFPLTDGFADAAAVPSDSLDGDPAVPAGCFASFGRYDDNLVVSWSGESEDRELRYLVTYPDAASAYAWVAQWRQAVEECDDEDFGRGTTRVHELVTNVELGTEESYAFVEQIRHDDGLLSELSLAVVGRVGNAVYVDYSFGSAGGEQVLQAELDRLRENSRPVVEAMCVFAYEGCPTEG